MSYTVTQNTTFLTAASVLQKVISFAYFILVARLIGVENTGQYFFAITFTTIFTVVADFGLGPVLTRETARFPENSERYLNTVLIAKLVFGIGAYILVIFFINIFKYPLITKELVYLSGVTMLFDNIQSVFYSIFRARKNLIYESIGVVASQLITLIIGTVALLNHWPLIWLIAAYTIPSFLNCIFISYYASKVFNLKYNFAWDKQVFKIFIITALPFAIAGIISRLYSYTDSLLMSKMLTAKELGWWSVPYKMTFAFQFVPVALSASVYPVFSNLFIGDKSRIGPLFEKSWRYLFTIVFPLSIGLIVLADPVIKRIYGADYSASITPLRLLLVSLIFGFLTFITGALLNACNKQKIQTSLIAGALVINIICNLILLPRFHITGAALSALISNFLLLVGGFYFSKRQADISVKNIFKYINQTFWPAVLMGVIVYLLSLKLHFIITIPIGAVVYFSFLFLTGGIDLQRIRTVYSKVFKKSPVIISPNNINQP